jgi:hypothetical protein
MVAPDGDVYLGVLANPNNGSRGFLLRFQRRPHGRKDSGRFGWVLHAAIVPASMVPIYHGGSPYLIFTKYNNYRIADGDGVNRIALLDPNQTQGDPHPTANGLIEMREVLTVIGPTPDAPTATFPFAVREWCINTAAVQSGDQQHLRPERRRQNLSVESRHELAVTSRSAHCPVSASPTCRRSSDPTERCSRQRRTLFAVGTSGRAVITMTSSKPDMKNRRGREALTFTAYAVGRGSAGVAFRRHDGIHGYVLPVGVPTPSTRSLRVRRLSTARAHSHDQPGCRHSPD